MEHYYHRLEMLMICVKMLPPLNGTVNIQCGRMQVSKPTEDDSNDVTDDTTDEAGEASEHEASKH